MGGRCDLMLMWLYKLFERIFKGNKCIIFKMNYKDDKYLFKVFFYYGKNI